jgi:hypothetical protein
MKKILLSALLPLCLPVNADLASSLRRYVGYTIVHIGQITGWRDENNNKKGDAFEGCEYGRVLMVDYSKQVTCIGYGYQYSYHPTAIFLSKSGSMKMIVDGYEYDIR